MKIMSRRSFVSTTAKGAGAAVVLSQIPESLLAQSHATNIPVGFQTWTIRDRLSADFSGTLKMMKTLGYEMAEMCSPKGYEKAGFAAFVDMKPPDIRSVINDAGLNCPSCHFGFGELKDHLSDSIEFARQLGLTQMICASFGLGDKATLSDYLSAADQMNRIGEKIKAAGMQAGFHNHSTEFHVLDGQLIYDALLERLDPDLVKMQFQTEVINLGYKASTYFNKFPGRFISSHLSDWTGDKKQVPVGKGIIDWKDFFDAAKKGGVKNVFVEMELENMRESAVYVKQVE
jgi:sugar phosphate isomerase/epimerase